jgi:hypothetical protein
MFACVNLFCFGLNFQVRNREGRLSPIVAELYDIDAYSCGYDHSENGAFEASAHVGGRSGERKRVPKGTKKRKTEERVFLMLLNDVLDFGTHLGHRDVL